MRRAPTGGRRPMEALLVLAALCVAFSNGANDNFKGVATVWGSQLLSYREALLLATLTTVAGSLASVYLADGLVRQFSGRGLVPDAVVAAPAFVVSVAVGAAATVLLATRTGFPVSTTHALIGGLIGAGLGQSGEVYVGKLAGSFVMPLLLSPLLAASLAAVAYRLLRRQAVQAECVCGVGPTRGAAPGMADVRGAVCQGSGPLGVVVASTAECDALPAPAARFSLAGMGSSLHVLSAATICFARGGDDTPKLVALLLVAKMLDASMSVPVI